MSDEKINAFIRDVRAHGISVCACFNPTDHGGAGDKAGGASVSDRPLKATLADALMRDQGRNRLQKNPRGCHPEESAS